MKIIRSDLPAVTGSPYVAEHDLACRRTGPSGPAVLALLR
jgi:hypothetical protein